MNLAYEIDLPLTFTANCASNMLYHLWYLVSLTIWNYVIVILNYRSHFFYQQRPNWLFGHYRALTSLLGKN